MLVVIPALFFRAGRPSSPEHHLVQLVNWLDPPTGMRIRVLVHEGNQGVFQPRSDRVELVKFPSGTHHRIGRLISEQALVPAYLAAVGANLLHFQAHVGPAVSPCPTVGTFLHHPFRDGMPRAKRAYFWALERLSTRRAERIIAISHESKADLVRHLGYPAERVDVIYIGVREQFLSEPTTDVICTVRERYGLDTPYILSPTTTAYYKKTDVLIQAFGLLKQRGYRHRLVLTGNNDPRLIHLWRARVGLAENDILLTGYIPFAEMPPLYAGASLIAYVSAAESFGVPLVEAQAAGVPAVVSPLPVLKEIGGDAVLAAAANTPESIADALERVLGDASLRKALVQRGRARVPLFSWRNAASRTLDVYLRAQASITARKIS